MLFVSAVPAKLFSAQLHSGNIYMEARPGLSTTRNTKVQTQSMRNNQAALLAEFLNITDRCKIAARWSNLENDTNPPACTPIVDDEIDKYIHPMKTLLPFHRLNCIFYAYWIS